MFAGLIVVVLTITALALCVAGFMANTRRFETSMKPPGFYWTWGMVALVAVGFMAGAPWWVRVAGLAVLIATVWLWHVDRKEGASR